MITQPLLRHSNFQELSNLTTDASSFTMGTILSQKFGNDTLPIAYASQKLNAAKQNYSATERECLAVVWAVKHFHCYLYGHKFQVLTDHRPLKWLMNERDPTSRLVIWNLKLQAYEFEIIHRPGKPQTHVDTLSRIIMAITKIDTTEGAIPLLTRHNIKLVKGRTRDVIWGKAGGIPSPQFRGIKRWPVGTVVAVASIHL